MMPLNPNGKVDRKALPIPTLGSGLTSSMSSLSQTDQNLDDLMKSLTMSSVSQRFLKKLWSIFGILVNNNMVYANHYRYLFMIIYLFG